MYALYNVPSNTASVSAAAASAYTARQMAQAAAAAVGSGATSYAAATPYNAQLYANMANFYTGNETIYVSSIFVTDHMHPIEISC